MNSWNMFKISRKIVYLSFVLKKDKQMEFVFGIIFLVGGLDINQWDIYLRGGGEPGDHEFTCEPLIWLYQENKNSNWTQTRNELGWERVN